VAVVCSSGALVRLNSQPVQRLDGTATITKKRTKTRMAGPCAWALLTLVLCATLAQAGTLVVAPHPDDDLLTAAGVIFQAVQAGEPVTVVYMTNGDNNRTTSYGLARQAEAVEGQRRLGLQEDHLIFLGYPDGYLSKILTDYIHPGETLVTAFNRSATYGRRGLGRMDYHAYRFGGPGNYNRAHLVADLADIIAMQLPAHIYVPSEFDTHPDHCATYALTKLAVLAVHDARPDYLPVIHKTVVHWAHLPWQHPVDATALFSEPPGWDRTGLAWRRRESLDVPLPMQSADLSVNPKYQAIAAHASQGGVNGYLKNYVHKDEFFWAENIVGGNQPPVAEAGTDLFVTEGAAVALDGSCSRDPEGQSLRFEWVQVSGGRVPLVNAAGPAPRFTAPEGLSAERVLVFRLVVRDHQSASAPDLTCVTIQPAFAKLGN